MVKQDSTVPEVDVVHVSVVMASSNEEKYVMMDFETVNQITVTRPVAEELEQMETVIQTHLDTVWDEISSMIMVSLHQEPHEHGSVQV